MIQVQPGQRPHPQYAHGHPPHDFCAEAPCGHHSEKDPRFAVQATLDSNSLSQRLGTLLIDIQGGQDQVLSVWQRWQGDADDVPTAVIDKPQTAPPPSTPPELTYDARIQPPGAQPGPANEGARPAALVSLDALSL
ncbi:hypothetical protein MSPP1_003066 [Malassezia sp. CBS 17886]|nr:hypothetical protein MSPP1_003066 [Malassezia sp. CBS 17886]